MRREAALFLALGLAACGGGGFKDMKRGMEADFAAATYRDLHAAGAIVEDPLLVGLVQAMGDRIEGPANRKRQTSWAWHVMEWEIPNAFNAGDGDTYLTTGLLRWAESTDEIAMIMGHEAAHTADGHITEAIGDMMAESLFIGVIAVAVGGDAANLASVIASLRRLSYGRDHEYAADRMGARFAWEAGYNPHYATTFFERLRQWEPEGDPSEIEIAFMSHPPTADRIRRLEAQAEAEFIRDPVAAAAMGDILLARGFPTEAIPFAQAGRGHDAGATLREAQQELDGQAGPRSHADREVSAAVHPHDGDRVELADYEIVEMFNATLWGLLGTAERHLEAAGHGGAEQLGDLTCLDEHRGWLEDEKGRWPLLWEWRGEAPEPDPWPRGDEDARRAKAAAIRDLWDCSVPVMVGGGQALHDALEDRREGSGRQVLWEFFGTAGPVSHDRGVRAAWDEALAVSDDRGSRWIVFHLLYHDLLRAWQGPLHFLEARPEIAETA